MDDVIIKFITLLLFNFFLILPDNIIAHSDFPLSIGNFALPMALQPSPLFSFGQNIIEKDDRLFYINPIYYNGKNGRSSFVNELYLLYGLSDHASIFILFNIPAINKDNNMSSSGFGDTAVQAEYAYLNKQTATSSLQLTAVGSIFLPSGMVNSMPQEVDIAPHYPFTGNGSVSFFLGGTANYTTINWYLFASIGHLFTITRDETKIGSTTVYQAGIGHNLRHFDDKVLLLLFELGASTAKRDILMGTVDPNSGGNSVYFGPSVYFSSKQFILQTGIQVPIYQNLFGVQNKFSYVISTSVAYKF